MVALDIFIGLVLIYFLYSLLASIIVEMVSTWIGMRARMLRQGIDNLLNDKQSTPGYSVDFIKWLKDIFLVEPSDFKYSNGGRFFKEPSIKYMAKPGDNFLLSTRNTKPAYISKENFTHTILNMVSQRSQGINEWDKIKFAIKHNAMALEPETLKMFQDWVARSNDSYGNFITNVERTYTEMMDRVNGWYKRKVQLFLSVIGFTLCFIMNVDTFQIVKILVDNPDVRKSTVEMAISTAQANQNLLDSSYPIAKREKINGQVSEVKSAYLSTLNSIDKTKEILGTGWTFPSWAENKVFKLVYIICQAHPLTFKFWGIIITTLALSLGAQFWYDLLKKLVALRGAGVKPEERDQKLKEELEIKKNGNDGLATLTKDPVEIAISENIDYWEKIPGFISANSVFDNDYKKNIVHLIFGKGKNPFGANITQSKNDITVKILEAQKNTLSDEGNNSPIYPEGAIINNKTKAWGTPSGIFLNKRTNKKVILTCGHVLREKSNAFFEKDKIEISIKLNNNDTVIGKVKNIVMSAFCDAGIVEIDNENDFSRIKTIKSINKFREVTPFDNQRTSITIKKLSEEITEGIIIRTKEYHTFDDNGQDVRYFDLIIMSHKTDQTIPISKEGDSGALICDIHDTPIGILVGGAQIEKEHFTYGIKIKDIIDILQLDTI